MRIFLIIKITSIKTIFDGIQLLSVNAGNVQLRALKCTRYDGRKWRYPITCKQTIPENFENFTILLLINSNLCFR